MAASLSARGIRSPSLIAPRRLATAGAVITARVELSGKGISRNENAVKVGKDQYQAMGLESSPDNPTRPFTQDEIETKLSELTHPPGDVVLMEIEIYKRPKKP